MTDTRFLGLEGAGGIGRAQTQDQNNTQNKKAADTELLRQIMKNSMKLPLNLNSFEIQTKNPIVCMVLYAKKCDSVPHTSTHVEE